MPLDLEEFPAIRMDINVIAHYMQHFKKDDIKEFAHCMEENRIGVKIYDDEGVEDGQNFKQETVMQLGINIAVMYTQSPYIATGLNLILKKVFKVKVGTGLIPPPESILPNY